MARLLAHLALGIATLAFRFGRYTEERRLAAIQRWSRRLCALAGVHLEYRGSPPQDGLLVMNHISWLDPFVMNAAAPSRFIGKAEIARWPVVGYLCTRVGTLYLERGSRSAVRRANAAIIAALGRGERVAVFPEGSTTFGDELLKFHAALLQPAITQGCTAHPVALQYLDRHGAVTRAPSYVGEQSLGASVWTLLGERHVTARLVFGQPVSTAGRHRRELASALHAAIIRYLGPDGGGMTSGTASRRPGAPR